MSVRKILQLPPPPASPPKPPPQIAHGAWQARPSGWFPNLSVLQKHLPGSELTGRSPHTPARPMRVGANTKYCCLDIQDLKARATVRRVPPSVLYLETYIVSSVLARAVGLQAADPSRCPRGHEENVSSGAQF